MLSGDLSSALFTSGQNHLLFLYVSPGAGLAGANKCTRQVLWQVLLTLLLARQCLSSLRYFRSIFK